MCTEHITLKLTLTLFFGGKCDIYFYFKGISKCLSNRKLRLMLLFQVFSAVNGR